MSGHSSYSYAICWAPQGSDDLAGCLLKIGEVLLCHLSHGEGRPDPKNVNRAISTRAIPQRHGNCGKPIVEPGGAVIGTTRKTRIARGVAALAHLAQNPV